MISIGTRSACPNTWQSWTVKLRPAMHVPTTKANLWGMNLINVFVDCVLNASNKGSILAGMLLTGKNRVCMERKEKGLSLYRNLPGWTSCVVDP
tara:strand:+ start:171 stop:452 length:282 start_codon:yes stop_codon:yes gene_type:complete